MSVFIRLFFSRREYIDHIVLSIAMHSITFKVDRHCSTEFSATVTIPDNGVFKSFLFFSLKKLNFCGRHIFFLKILMCEEFRYFCFVFMFFSPAVL